MEISHTNTSYVKVFGYPSWLRSIKGLTLKKNIMNISSIGEPSGDALMFKYTGELTVEKTLWMKAMLESLLFFEQDSKT